MQQGDSEVATGPTEGETSPSEVNWDIEVPTSSSGLLLRRGEAVIILSERNFLDGLEDFEKRSLTEQRREMRETLANVY